MPQKKSESGQSMVEGMLCMLLLCLVLFGLLQIFYLSVAQMLTDFSAYQAARSDVVGFAEYLVDRSGRTAAIGASGLITYPSDVSDGSPLTLLAAEEIMVPEYRQGVRWLEYEYWYGENESKTTFDISQVSGFSTSGRRATFDNYPMNFPMRSAFSSSDTVTLTSTSYMIDHASYYLDRD